VTNPSTESGDEAFEGRVTRRDEHLFAIGVQCAVRMTMTEFAQCGSIRCGRGRGRTRCGGDF